MAYTISNFLWEPANDDVYVKEAKGPFKVVEWKRDLSVTPATAASEYFSAEMNVRRRQLECDVMPQMPILLQAGAMQWMAGNINVETGVRGAGDLIGKAFRGSVSGESAIKPVYSGFGSLVLEPTYKHIILLDVGKWGQGVVLEDGMFLAAEASLQHHTVMRQNISSAAAGGEGFFNLCLSGNGVAAVESFVPREELIVVDLDNDQIKIDGPLAVAWSSSLSFTVERTTKTLLGSAASGEGLVNVYRGTGRVLMAPMK